MRKGKLFGKLHILDALVLLLLIAAAAVLIGGHLKPADTPAAAQRSELIVEAVVSAPDPQIREEILRQEPKGKALYNGSAATSAYVEDCWLEESELVATTAEGEKLRVAQEERPDLVFRLRGSADPNAPTLSICGQEMRAGRTMFINTEGFSVVGVIRYVELAPNEES